MKSDMFFTPDVAFLPNFRQHSLINNGYFLYRYKQKKYSSVNTHFKKIFTFLLILLFFT